MDKLITFSPLKEHDLSPYLARLRGRLRLRDGLLLAQRTLWWALLAGALILVAGRIWPIENPWQWALIPLGLWLVGVLGYTLFRPQPTMRIARRVDAELHLKERLSTSLALDQAQGAAMRASFEPELIEEAHADALASARRIDPARDFPITFERRAMLIAGGMLIAAALLVWLPNPMSDKIQERKAVAEEAKRQAAQVDKLREQVQNAKEMSPEERDALLKKLAELAKQLRANNGDREQALADLSKLEESLRPKLDPKSAQQQAALQAMAAQLQAMAKSPNPQIGDLKAAAEAMQKLAEQMPKMSEEERKAAAQQLAQMAARAAQAGDSAMAQALSAMSQAMQTGDAQQAQDAAQKGADALNQAQSSQANQQAFNQTLQQLQNSRQQMTQAGNLGKSMAQQPGQSGQQGQQPGQGSQPGQSGNQPGQGQSGQGQGQGQGQQAGGGGGTNASQLPPATRTGKAGSPTGAGKDTGKSDTQSNVYAPRDKASASNGDKLYVPGQDTNQGQTQTKEGKDPLGGANAPALVPYSAVYQNYLDAANRTMDQSYIPPALKDYIKAYFSQLEP